MFHHRVDAHTHQFVRMHHRYGDGSGVLARHGLLVLCVAGRAGHAVRAGEVRWPKCVPQGLKDGSTPTLFRPSERLSTGQRRGQADPYGYRPHLYAKATRPARECTWHLR